MQDKTFLKHVNGLRGLAILSILLYHLSHEYCPAGFYGVDLFLVISGFFLARNTMAQIQDKDFSLLAFLVSKAKRILLPAIVVALAVVALSLFIYRPGLVNQIASTAKFTCLFSGNFYLDQQGGYFDIKSDNNPLLHFWYIGVILQSYILTLIFLFIARFKKITTLFLLLSFVAILSYFLMRFYGDLQEGKDTWKADLVRLTGIRHSHYNTITRYWEIICGFLAFSLTKIHKNGCLILHRIGGVLSLAIFSALLFHFSFGSSPIKFMALSCILLVVCGDTFPCSLILNSRPMQILGTCSYSIYLVHWPVFCIGKYLCMDNTSFLPECVMVTMAFLLSYLLWRYVETRVFSWKSGISSVFAVISFLFFCTSSTPSIASKIQFITLPDTARHISSTPTASRPTVRIYNIERDVPSFSKGFFHLGSSEAPAYSFIILGDSHAHHYHYGFNIAADKRRMKGIGLGNSVAPFWNYAVSFDDGGDINWNEQYANEFMNWLKRNETVRYVFLSMHWNRRIFHDYRAGWNWNGELKTREELDKLLTNGLTDFCRRVTELNRVVILIRDTPDFHELEGISPLDEAFRYAVLRSKAPLRFVSEEEFAIEHKRTDALFRDICSKGYARLIDVNHLCMREGKYPAVIDGFFYYSDDHHLSGHASRVLSEEIFHRLFDTEEEPHSAN